MSCIIIVVITNVIILGTIKTDGDVNLENIAAGVFEGNFHVPRHPLTL